MLEAIDLYNPEQSGFLFAHLGLTNAWISIIIQCNDNVFWRQYE